MPETAVAPKNAFSGHRRTATILVLVVLLVAGAFAGYRWRNGLHVFGPADVGEVGAAVAIGKAYYADAVFAVSGHPRVDVRSVSPHVTSNSAAAAYQVLTCHRGRQNVLGAPPAPQFCADRPVPFHPGTYAVGSGEGQVTFVIRFTPRSGGVFEFHGVDISYDVGWRHGVQRTGIDQQYRTP